MESTLRNPRAAATHRAAAVSIVVPFLNEATNLPVLTAHLKSVLDLVDRSAEVVLVDDGSTDDSWSVALAASEGDRRFRVVRLRANFGKSAALAAGRDHSVGDVIVTMDADMQDPPEEIPRFLAEIDRGNDLVAGWRNGRQAPWPRRVCSALFNHLVRAVSGIRIHDMNCGMKAYRRRVLDSIFLSRGMHRFTVMLALGHGFRVSELPIPNCERLSGTTKFGAGRYLEAALGLVGALYLRRPSRTPLTSFGALGALALLVASCAGGALALWPPADGRTLLVLLVAIAALFLLGAVLLVAGLVGELLLHRLAATTRPAPLYELRETSDDRQ